MLASPLPKKILFIALLTLSLIPTVTAPMALLAGILYAIFLGNPFASQSALGVKWLLKAAVIGLGFGMSITTAVAAGREGLLLTVATLIVVMGAGFLLGKWLKVDSKSSYLVSSGTAICGGSAIAALAPITGANARQISVALGTVFILNAVALFVFPLIGAGMGLSQYQFGLWSAIAIHDTSSVVGAASAYGNEALATATTVKLSRALWIVPLSLVTALFSRRTGRISIPYFIFLFIGAMAVSSAFPEFNEAYQSISWIAKRLLVATLFLIGSGLSLETLKSVGVRVFAQGMILWILISALSLAAILIFY